MNLDLPSAAATYLGFASPLPYLLVILLCLGAAHLIAGHSRFFRQRLQEEAGGRHVGVDGLRGFLALGVFFTHVINTWYLNSEGLWTGHGAQSWGATGEAGVAMFFMITGFLFWGRVLRQTGTGGLDVAALYRSRLRRIVPMYLVSVLAVLVVVAVMSGFRLQVGLFELVRELRAWFSFGFMDNGDINGVAGTRYINAVYWTLAFEWGFYLSLPFLALFAHGRWSVLLFGLAVLFGLRAPVVLNFLCGALAALAMHRGWLAGRLASPWYAPLALLSLYGALQYSYSVPHTVLLFACFLIVVGGNTLFGLLATNAARMLGMVSYSIYLMHSIVLFVVMRLVDQSLSLASLDPVAYWLFAALAALLAVLVSAFTYRHVEYPFFAPQSGAPGWSRPWFSPAHAS